MIKFTILGCGSSMGVPRADGNWGKCDPKVKRNYRTKFPTKYLNGRNILSFRNA